MPEQRNMQTNNGNAAIIGFAGAIVGAGVAVAASRIFSDKETREKVYGAVGEIKKQLIHSMQTIQVTAEDGPKIIKESIEENIAPKKMRSVSKKTVDTVKTE